MALCRIIRLFEEQPQFTVEDRLATFEGRRDKSLYTPEVNYEGLFAAYGLEPTNFREKVARLDNPQEIESPKGEPFKLNWATSVDILAARHGKLGAGLLFTPAACGVLKTRDNQIAIGLRGGKITPERRDIYGSGLMGASFGGSVAFKQAYSPDPITETLRDEFAQEMGDFETCSRGLLGICEAYKPGPTGIKFVGLFETDATLQQLQEVNQRSNELYAKLMAQPGAKKPQVLAEIAAKDYLPMLGNILCLSVFPHEESI